MKCPLTATTSSPSGEDGCKLVDVKLTQKNVFKNFPDDPTLADYKYPDIDGQVLFERGFV